jgi:hypothetical protein
MPSMLREALLESVTVDPDSLAGGKLIRELQLRTPYRLGLAKLLRQWLLSDMRLARYFLALSRINVTGPALVRETSIMAWNLPL